MQTVRIRVRKPTRVLTFLSKDVDLDRSDKCVVRSDRGLEFGTCITPPEPCSEQEEHRFKMQVVRKATPQDEITFYRILEDEQHAASVCKRKIEERKLPMKLVDTEYTFDKNKIVFHFTAADRVDFRDLVRDLAHDLKTRIELRHIQVRDEAKIVGGLGVCGRELCCSTWLREFKPISMKMAKRQNLSLNPSKISGQCGRLLCCLSYENELYQKRRKKDMDEATDAQRAAYEAIGIDPYKAFLAPHEVDALEKARNAVDEDREEPAYGMEAESPEEEPVHVAKAPARELPDERQETESGTETAPEQRQPAGRNEERAGQEGGGQPRKRRRRRRRRGASGGDSGGGSGGGE